MSSEKELEARLQDAWRKFLPEMHRRLEVIIQAEKALIGRKLDQSLQADAAQQAHKLSGSLGTFGREGGSAAATKLEELFTSNNVQDKSARHEIRNLLEVLKRDIQSE